MNHKVIGDKTESVILSELIKRDYNVSIPFGENQRYDLIIEKFGKLERIQCKTGRIINGCVQFNTSSSTHNKRSNYIGQIEAFIVFFHEKQEMYYIPIQKAKKTEMRLRLEEPKKYGMVNTINWSSDFKM